MNVITKMFATEAKHHKVAFFDFVDFDNPMAIAIMAKNLESHTYLHIVGTGHPVSFAVTNVYDGKFKNYENAVVKFDHTKHIRELPHEKKDHNPVDADALLQVYIYTTAAMIFNLFGQDVLDRCRFYNGGIAEKAGLSHAVHAYAEYFVTPLGQVRTYAQYQTEVSRIFGQSTCEERIESRRDYLTEKKNAAEKIIKILILPMKELAALLDDCAKLDFIVGGPLTGLALLGSHASKKLLEKSGVARAMNGCIDGSQNLLYRNFNAAVSPEAFDKVVVQNMFPNLQWFFWPTETCKLPNFITFDPEDFAKKINEPYLADLYALWCAINRNKPMPMFDIACLIVDSPFEVVPVKFRLTSKKISDTETIEVDEMIPCRKSNMCAYMPTIKNPLTKLW